MNSDAAEIMALQALNWLLAEEELLPVFVGATGTSAEDLAARAGDPELLGSVLDFILMDDAWIAGFCGTHGLPMDAPMQARQALPGGALPNWT